MPSLNAVQMAQELGHAGGTASVKAWPRISAASTAQKHRGATCLQRITLVGDVQGGGFCERTGDRMSVLSVQVGGDLRDTACDNGGKDNNEDKHEIHMHSMYTGQTFHVCIHITLTPLISTTTLRRRHCYFPFTEEKTEAPRGRELLKFTHLISGRAGVQIEAFCSSPPSYLLMIPPPSQCKGKGGSSLPHPPCRKEAGAQMRAFEPLLTYFTAQGGPEKFTSMGSLD